MGLVLQYADAASDKAMRPSVKQIMTTPVGRKLLGKLNSDSQTYLIHSGFNSAGESNFQQGNDVYVDPNADIDVPQENACSTRKFSTTRILAHELGHLTGTEDGPSDAAMENVNKWENPIMFPLERFNRTRYWK